MADNYCFLSKKLPLDIKTTLKNLKCNVFNYIPDADVVLRMGKISRSWDKCDAGEGGVQVQSEKYHLCYSLHPRIQ